MTPVERLQAAIKKLEALQAGSRNWRVAITADEDGPQVIHNFETESYGLGTGTLAWTTSDDAAEHIVTLHRTTDAQLAILRNTVRLHSEFVALGKESVWLEAIERAGDLALADAIIGSDQ